MSTPAIHCTPIDALSADESARFARLTKQAKRDIEVLRSVVPVHDRLCDTLAEIRNDRLYRAEFDTFDEFCRQELGISPSYASRKIKQGEVFRDLATGPIGNDSPGTLPMGHESQTRPLNALTVEKRREAWSQAVADAEGKQPTAKQVKAAADRVTGKAEPADVSKARAAGIIPEGARVTVEEPDDAEAFEDSTDALADDGSKPDEATHTEWLRTLPIRERLTGKALERFDRAAILFRAMTPARLALRNACRTLINGAKRDGGFHIDQWMRKHNSYVATRDPSDWVECQLCKDGSGRSTGLLPGFLSPCPTCGGDGFHIDGGWRNKRDGGVQLPIDSVAS